MAKPPGTHGTQRGEKKPRQTIQYAKTHHWHNWLEKVTEPNIWTAHKYISAPASEGGKTRIPSLTVQDSDCDRIVSKNSDKSTALAKEFFPKKPQHQPNNLDTNNFPAPVCKMDPLTKEQIRRHIARLRLFKVPGPDGIPNIVLIKCSKILFDRLWPIFTVIVNKGWYYAPWKMFTTIVLQNPSKPRYDIPKAYRPIVLLNMLSKALTAIITKQLTFYSEKPQILPLQHYSRRLAQTTTDAMHLLTHKIKNAWHKKQVILVLFLDIEGAFPNAVNKKLIQNMKKHRVPEKIVQFTENLLHNQHTTLKSNNYTSESIPIRNGIGQGDPLLMILYQY
jgi:hypothetical protein